MVAGPAAASTGEGGHFAFLATEVVAYLADRYPTADAWGVTLWSGRRERTIAQRPAGVRVPPVRRTALADVGRFQDGEHGAIWVAGLARDAGIDRAAIRVMARLLSAVLETETRADRDRAALEAATMHAETDALTGVLNRRGWHRRLDDRSAPERKRPGLLVAVDLDGLKAVNDARGHGAGDELLQTAASALVSALRGSDVVARLGGDEFGVLVTEVDDDTRDVVEARIRAALSAAGVAASIGSAILPVGGDSDMAWAAADTRMYHEKHQRTSAR